MAVRRVEIRLVTVDSEARAALLEDKKLVDGLDGRRISVRLAIDDGGGGLKLDKLSLQLDKLGMKDAKPRVDIQGITGAILAVDLLSAKLDALGAKTARPGVGGIGDGAGGGIGALERSIRNDTSLLRNEVTVSRSLSDTLRQSERTAKLVGEAERALALPGGNGGGGGGLFSSLRRLFTSGGGGGGGAGSGLLSSLAGASNQFTGAGIAALLGLAGSIAPAIIPFGLGGLIGGGAAFGALSIGSKAHQQLLQLQQERQMIVGKTPADRQMREILSGRIAGIQQQNGPALQAFGAFSQFGHSALGTFFSALTTPGAGQFTMKGGKPTFLAGAPSFMQGLTGIFSQLGGFVKSIGPQLGDMFRASLPFISAFVKILEQAAKIMMPAFTQALNALKPDIPTIVQGFAELSKAVAFFIKDLGPGMKDASVVFKGIMLGVKGIMIGLAAVFNTLAHVFRFVGRLWVAQAKAMGVAFHALGTAAKASLNFIVSTAISFGHWIVHTFDTVRAGVVAVWNSLWRTTIHVVQSGISSVVSFFKALPGRIVGALSSLGHALFSVGINAIRGLLSGLQAAAGSVLSYAAGLAGKIASTIASALRINSPSLVMHKIGLSIGEGLSLGMSHSVAGVNTSAARLALGIPGAFSGAYIPAQGRMTGGSYGGGRGATLTVRGQGDDLLKAVVKALRYDIRATSGGNVQTYLGWGG